MQSIIRQQVAQQGSFTQQNMAAGPFSRMSLTPQQQCAYLDQLMYMRAMEARQIEQNLNRANLPFTPQRQQQFASQPNIHFNQLPGQPDPFVFGQNTPSFPLTHPISQHAFSHHPRTVPNVARTPLQAYAQQVFRDMNEQSPAEFIHGTTRLQQSTPIRTHPQLSQIAHHQLSPRVLQHSPPTPHTPISRPRARSGSISTHTQGTMVGHRSASRGMNNRQRGGQQNARGRARANSAREDSHAGLSTPGTLNAAATGLEQQRRAAERLHNPIGDVLPVLTAAANSLQAAADNLTSSSPLPKTPQQSLGNNPKAVFGSLSLIKSPNAPNTDPTSSFEDAEQVDGFTISHEEYAEGDHGHGLVSGEPDDNYNLNDALSGYLAQGGQGGDDVNFGAPLPVSDNNDRLNDIAKDANTQGKEANPQVEVDWTQIDRNLARTVSLETFPGPPFSVEALEQGVPFMYDNSWILSPSP
jgi:hypothetical protein